MRLSIVNFLGVLFSLGILVFGITETIGVTNFLANIPIFTSSVFVSVPSLIIVMGGILNAIFITYQPKYVGQAFLSIFYLFSQSKTSSRTLEMTWVKL